MDNLQGRQTPSFPYEDAHSLIAGHHYNPHQFLGLQETDQGDKVIRLWRSGAKEIYFELLGEIKKARMVDALGIFEYNVSKHILDLDYRVYDYAGELHFDPYNFSSTFGEVDEYLFSKGVHYDLYDKMGARLCIHEGVKGVKFAVWAPNAVGVSLVGDFNHWNGLSHPMRILGGAGVWEIFIPELREGDKYKFEIRTKCGKTLLKSDPYAYETEFRPDTASIVAHLDAFQWSDSKWVEKRQDRKWWESPLNIYEVHLGSWKYSSGNFLNYRDLAHQLAEYCQYMGYTHVELLSPAEHPLDESWGYQVTGYYSVTSRHGKPEDFQYFVNHMHDLNIGVILDWVPGHFPIDDHALSHFDGTALYEHADHDQKLHPHWGTYIFNYGRHEVSNFLIANADFWFNKMHIDGLRVDAVASMLYLDYGREDSNWIRNKYGGNENLEAVEFMKHLNAHVHSRFPGVLMIAEESTSFPGVTHMASEGGLGFDLKWNMGWMNDTLKYFSKDPVHRSHHHNLLTFGFLYTFTEKFALVLSHDEVVHGKKSLLSKMPGDSWQQFANLRLLLSYMVTIPGKNLIFQGGEFGQWSEWNCKEEIHWNLLEEKMHRGLHDMTRDLNHLYLKSPELWQYDHDWRGFEWVTFNDTENGVIGYLRKSENGCLFVLNHFTPNYSGEYYVPLENLKEIHEIFNSDDEKYGGSGKLNLHPEITYHDGYPNGIKIKLAPLSTMIFDVDFNM